MFHFSRKIWKIHWQNNCLIWEENKRIQYPTKDNLEINIDEELSSTIAKPSISYLDKYVNIFSIALEKCAVDLLYQQCDNLSGFTMETCLKDYKFLKLFLEKNQFEKDCLEMDSDKDCNLCGSL